MFLWKTHSYVDPVCWIYIWTSVTLNKITPFMKQYTNNVGSIPTDSSTQTSTVPNVTDKHAVPHGIPLRHTTGHITKNTYTLNHTFIYFYILYILQPTFTSHIYMECECRIVNVSKTTHWDAALQTYCLSKKNTTQQKHKNVSYTDRTIVSPWTEWHNAA
jgi:hypothetical protein